MRVSLGCSVEAVPAGAGRGCLGRSAAALVFVRPAWPAATAPVSTGTPIPATAARAAMRVRST